VARTARIQAKLGESCPGQTSTPDDERLNFGEESSVAGERQTEKQQNRGQKTGALVQGNGEGKHLYRLSNPTVNGEARFDPTFG
jgi:hypothetical protein